MERRNFLKFAVAGVPGSIALAELGGIEMVTLASTSCTPPTWVNSVLNILNLLLPAVSGILAIAAAFTGIPVPAAVITTVTTAVQTVISLVNQWINSPDPQRPGILGDLIKAADLMQQNITQILNAIRVENAVLQSKIIAAVNVVVSMINTLLALLPQATTGKVVAPSAASFKKAYNDIMNMPTTGAAPVTMKLTPEEIQALQRADAEAKKHLL